MLRNVLIIAAILGLQSLTFGQSKSITGQVKDTLGQPIAGVTIVEKGTTNGTFTDLKGNFTVVVQGGDSTVLVFSFISYKTLEFNTNGQTSVNVVLKAEASDLGEVLVVGYRSTLKRDFTGASSNLKGKAIEELNLPKMDQALQGQVAGVNISTNSGSPGGSSNIRIRGLSTFGDNDPLILVDGVVYDSEGMNAINPNDIESVTVLKDATAGIYGVRAANGVILIQTKKGRYNSAPRFTLSSYGGMQYASKKLDLLNATEYAVVKNEMFANGNDGTPFPNTQLGEGTDWQNAVFKPAAMSQYNVGVTGGTQNTTYSVGLSYFTQDGIVGLDKANFERINGRINFGVQILPKLHLTSVFLYTNEERNVLPENTIGSVLYNTINAFPTDPIKDEFGRYTYLEEVSDIINPLAQMENTYNTSYVNKFVGKEELQYKITPKLSFTNRFNYNVALVDDKVFSPLTWYGPGKAQNTAKNAELEPTQVEIGPGVLIDRGAGVYESRTTYKDLNFESFLNHTHLIGLVHSFNTTLGVSAFSRSGSNLNGTAYNIPNNSVEYADISANLAPGGFLNNVGSWQFEERLLSTFFRTDYMYAQKYMASAIIRRDGSSKFGPNARYGTFPTVAASWVLSEEDFYDMGWLPFFKIRASYGVSGNDQIPNFAYRGLLDGEGVYVFNDVITQGVAIGRAGNPDLKWETTSQFNLGLDFKLFRRFDITTNFFRKNTRDLLFQPDVSGVLGSSGAGGSAPVINAGDVSNTGVELELKYMVDITEKWRLNTSLNLTTIRNEVQSTPEGISYLPGANFGVGNNIATRFETGFPISYFIGYETDGVFQTQFEIDNSEVVQAGAKPGDLKYKDQNGDGKISFSDDSDKVMIGSPIPDLTIGFNLSMNYGPFDLSMFIYAALGQEIIRNYERQQPYANMLAYNINRWTGPGTTWDYHRLTTDLTRNGVFSDYYVEDGSFMRMRNIQLGYRLPASLLSKISLSSLRVYIASNNLFTWTNYQGFDPDIGTSAGTLSAGVDNGFYPQARTFMTGVSIQF